RGRTANDVRFHRLPATNRGRRARRCQSDAAGAPRSWPGGTFARSPSRLFASADSGGSLAGAEARDSGDCASSSTTRCPQRGRGVAALGGAVGVGGSAQAGAAKSIGRGGTVGGGRARV